MQLFQAASIEQCNYNSCLGSSASNDSGNALNDGECAVEIAARLSEPILSATVLAANAKGVGACDRGRCAQLRVRSRRERCVCVVWRLSEKRFLI